MMEKTKKISFDNRFFVDVITNIVSAFIPVFTLQLFILPIVSSKIGNDAYGLTVSIISAFSIFAGSTGNSLNNIRLIYSNEKTNVFNYNIISCILLPFALLSMYLFEIIANDKLDIIQIILDLLITFLFFCKEYLVVSFRLNINFKAILKSNVLLSVGYCIGLLLFLVSGYWQMVYVCGLVLCLTYICRHSSLWKESFRIDNKFKTIFSNTLLLLLGTFLYMIPGYADKMIIYPLMGGADTSALYISTLAGKVVGMTITPISGVILSYISRTKDKKEIQFNRTVFVGFLIGVPFYFFTVAVSRPVLSLLYPSDVDLAMRLIPITTATMIINSLITITDPYIMNFYKMQWQVIINGVYVLIYLLISLPLLGTLGLTGFCIGALITATIKYLFELVIFYCIKHK